MNVAASLLDTLADQRLATALLRSPCDGAVPNTSTATDFYAYLPGHRYIYTPTRDLWPAASVDARLGRIDDQKASTWLDKNRAVDQMTWAPGEDLIIKNRIVSDGGWIDRQDSAVFNLYRGPVAIHGNANKVGPWLDHLRTVFGVDGDHILKWLAHRVQHPGQKINHAIVLGGDQGIGKDTLLEPVKAAVGPWNFAEIAPSHLLGRFNGFSKSVILRVNEARDLGDMDRFAFYDHSKVYTASPPDVLRVDEKNLREHSVFNVCGVIITTNHKSDGIYLPGDDRRHFVAWSDVRRDQFAENYWNHLFQWYAAGGLANVTAYLRELDLSGFDPKAPPPKTEAFYEIVDANRAPEDAELADVIDILGNRAALTLSDLRTSAGESFRDWLEDRRNRRSIPHRLESAGYVPVRNPDAKDGLWKISGIRQAVYGQKLLTQCARLAAASDLAKPGQWSR